MTSQEIEDSVYFDGDCLRFTTNTGKHCVPLSAVFSQTAAMLDDCADAADIRSCTNALIIAFENGVKQLDTLAAGANR